ncbi:PKD domain-containing protein [Chondrinema litorale]|uniref:PKD domain-containing protein n=1 Tax=Chondrinema litorale TaxID=2994555 RepID=UPI00254345B0|nr:PKD domain-containing protein [Chondrinema litorale]UZR94639.1 PKD domain-containing protein [Chondrinema litorale]
MYHQFLLFYIFLLVVFCKTDRGGEQTIEGEEVCKASEVFRSTALNCDLANDRLYCVELQANDREDATGNLVSHLWLLGDGNMKPGNKVEHCYNVYGTYDVQLISTKKVEGIEFKDTTTYVLDVGEIALIQEIKEDRFVYFFDGSSSYIGEEFKVANYYWSFGDGNYACDMLVTNRYTKPGEYEVKLIVEGISGNGEIRQICGIKRITIR